jgi:uncharacterized protein
VLAIRSGGGLLIPARRSTRIQAAKARKGLIMNSRHHLFSFISGFTLIAALLAAVTPTLTHAAPPSPQSPITDVQTLADRGDAVAQYHVARNLLAHDPSPARVESALKYLRASASQNSPNAEYYLGYLYEQGRFVPQSYGLAFQNYQAAAQAHYPPAENNLASLYQHGEGVPKSISKAFELYLAAAQHGDPVAQTNLACMYYAGQGVTRSETETIRWLTLAANSGFADAQNSLAFFYFYGVAIQRDYTEAARLVRTAAQTGLPSAELSLGYLYETGKGVPLDYVSAYNWYTRAANAGNKDAAGRRASLAHVMTPHQLDAAANMAIAYSAQGPLQPSTRSATSPNSINTFSLLPH